MTESELEKLIGQYIGEDKIDEFEAKMESILTTPPLPEIAEYLGLTMAELSNSPNFSALRAAAIPDILFRSLKNLLIDYGVPEDHANLAANFAKRHAGL